MDLHAVWFIILGALLAGYAVLDGFDLGVGILHLLARTDRDRRLFMNAIGPIWDGNEVWLITFGGALFAAFPMAYATIQNGLGNIHRERIAGKKLRNFLGAHFVAAGPARESQRGQTPRCVFLDTKSVRLHHSPEKWQGPNLRAPALGRSYLSFDSPCKSSAPEA